jgi:Leucine-rich repeat (LRR) protein
MLRNVSSNLFARENVEISEAPPITPIMSEVVNTSSNSVVLLDEEEMEGADAYLKRSRDEKQCASTLLALKRAKTEEIVSQPPPLSSLIERVFNDPIILSTMIHFIDTGKGYLHEKPSLALTSINKEAFRLRFISAPWHSFYFLGNEIEQFLTYCQEYVKEDKLRTPDHFCWVRSLKLTLQDQLNIEQSAALLRYLPDITQLELEIDNNCLMDLSPLLEAAKALVLERLRIEGPHIDGDFDESIPKDFLPEVLFELTSLRKLSIKSFNIQSISEKLGRLENLTKLILCNLPLLSLPKSLGNLKSLTKLSLINLTMLKVLPNSIWQIVQLQYLKLAYLDINWLSEEIRNLKSLIRIELCYLLQLDYLPNGLGCLPALAVLKLEGLDISELPDSLSCLSSLASLKLASMHELESLPPSINRLLNLREFILFDLPELSVLPERLGDLRALKVLELSGLPITRLPNSIEQLKQLKRLILRNLNELLTFPSTIDEPSKSAMTMLVKPTADELESWTELYNLPALTQLVLVDLPKLQALPREFFAKKTLTLFIAEMENIFPNWPNGLGRGYISPLIIKNHAALPFYQTILAAIGGRGKIDEEEGKLKIDTSVLDCCWLADNPQFETKYGDRTSLKGRIAFIVQNRAQVNAFYQAGIANGGIRQGSPAASENGNYENPLFDHTYRENFYVAYLLAPDGNELAAICWGEGSE